MGERNLIVLDGDLLKIECVFWIFFFYGNRVFGGIDRYWFVVFIEEDGNIGCYRYVYCLNFDGESGDFVKD